jgi:large subunit ribosomal protein L22
MPAKSGREGADMPGVKTNEREGTRAVLRHTRISPNKARQVLDLIRGQDVDRAAEILDLGDREAATIIGKVLASAVANAVHNDGLNGEELFVSACYADEGSTLKRWRPRARGRATRIRKRTSHVTIIVSRLPEERLARRRAKQAASGTQRSRRVAGSRRRQRAETEVETRPLATPEVDEVEGFDDETVEDFVDELDDETVEDFDDEVADEVADEDEAGDETADEDEAAGEIADEEEADDETADEEAVDVDQAAAEETAEDEGADAQATSSDKTSGDSAEEKGK